MIGKKTTFNFSPRSINHIIAETLFDREPQNRTLKHLLQYSTLIPPQIKSRLSNAPIEQLRRSIEQTPSYLSEFTEFLSGQKKLNIPVYTVWGACEDVSILEKFRSKEYSIPNLNILDEATSHLLEIGGVNLRLFGLGGAVVQHKLFDNGEGTRC